MAAQDYFGAVQQLYISYFGRPADPTGLQNMAAALDAIGAPKEFGALQQQVQADRAGTTALSRLVNTFNNSAESNALYGTGTSVADIQKFVAAIYQNVLGREADIGGFNFWVGEITAGRLTKANAAASITAAAMTNTTPQGLLDKATVEKKLAVANAFTTDISDSASEIVAYNGDAAAATARTLLGAVTGTTDVAAYQSSIDAAIDNMIAVANPGQNLALSANIDNLIGGNGNDNFVATITTTANPIGSLDVLEGGAGRDTLSIADTNTTTDLSLTGLTVRNVENLVVSTSRALNLDVSATGVTNATLSSAATAGTNTVTAAGTTNVTLSAAAGANNTINGGRAVTVNGDQTNTVTGAALSSVTVNGGTAAIDNTNASAATGAGSTLTSVTLNGVDGANTITGRGVTTVNLNDIDTAGTTLAVANVGGTATARPLTLNLGGVENVAVTAANATAVTINAAADSEINVAAAAATTVTVAGAGDLDLDLTGSTSLTSLTSTATGTVDLSGLVAGVVTVTGGAGAERFTTTQTAAVTFNTGAGADRVTLGSAIAAGSTINLGAGNDALLLGAGGSLAASTSTAATVIDGGEGTDTLSAALINASNAGQFRNFESLDISAAAVLDVQLITGSTIAGLTLTGGTGTAATVNNVAAGVGLTVSGANTGVKTVNLASTSGTTDAFSIGFAGEAASAAPSAANVTAGTVVLNGVEAVSIASTGAANTWNSVTLTDSAVKTITITGDKNLDLGVTGAVGTAGTNGLATIDGSAATGKLAINLTGATLGVATAGLTVKGGTAADTITLAGRATVEAGAGDDVIVTAAAGGTLTGGAGKDVFNVGASAATAATEAGAVLTTIADFAAGDSINLGLTGAAATVTKLTLGSTVTTLQSALEAAGAATEGVVYFQYGNSTYLFADKGTAGFDIGDVVVKLTGNIDLSTAAMTSAGIVTL